MTRNEVRNAVLVAFGSQKGHKATVAQVSSTFPYLSTLLKKGIVADTGEVVKTGNKGRPAHVYSLTTDGEALLKSIRIEAQKQARKAKKAAAAEPVAA